MLTARHKLDFKTSKRSAKKISEASNIQEVAVPARLPRITKMMALAIRLDHLIKTGQVSDQAELARVGHVSRARLTQIMDLNLLAPDIQEKILFLPQFATVSAIPTEQSVRKIAQTTNWHSQRHLWKADQS